MNEPIGELLCTLQSVLFEFINSIEKLDTYWELRAVVYIQLDVLKAHQIWKNVLPAEYNESM